MGQKQLRKGRLAFHRVLSLPRRCGPGGAGGRLFEKSPATIACRLLHRPEILAACLMRAVEMHAEGQGLDRAGGARPARDGPGPPREGPEPA